MRALVLVVLLAACGRGVYRRPDVGPWTTSWRVARSPHFTVEGDLDEGDLRQRVRWLEASWWGLATVYGELFPGKQPPSARMNLVYFDDCEEPFPDDKVAGVTYYSSTTAVAIVCATGRDAERDTVAHELAHLFTAHHLGWAPRWLQEGLAGYLETIAIEDGVLRVGVPPRTKKYARWWPTVAQLRDADFDLGTVQLTGYYAGAWLLVHLLFDSDTLRPRFFGYLTALARGEDEAAAWKAAFDGVDLEDAYQDHRHAAQFKFRGFAMETPPEVEIAIAPMSLDEVLAADLWTAWIVVQNGTTLERAGKLLVYVERLAARFPTWGHAEFWSAAIAAASGDPAAAGVPDPPAALRAHIAAHPDDGRALALLVELGVATEDEVRALARVADETYELLAVAHYYAAAERPETGISWAKRALATWPLCDGCHHTLAAMYAQQARWADAAAAEERAIAILTERAVPEVYVRALERYRAEAARATAP